MEKNDVVGVIGELNIFGIDDYNRKIIPPVGNVGSATYIRKGNAAESARAQEFGIVLRSTDHENPVCDVDSGLIDACLQHAQELGAIL
ncbi:hypothetical protein [Alloacidobacterium dinghuense]|uniref:hypothetical protein n=1 Tax=Alloacidobacterium dinghuense TaxID=2763107 RepID=UPI002036C07B|nr:hypothetical protein [Alloacidobacterium dinghuense]